MTNRRDRLNNAGTGRYAKMLLAVLISLTMLFSGIAPSFAVYAEDEVQDQAVQTAEAETPEVKEAPQTPEQPAPVSEPEPAASSDTDTGNTSSAGDNDEPQSTDNDTDHSRTGITSLSSEGSVETEETSYTDANDEKAYPAASFSGETSDVRVSASAGKGVFPEGTSMKVKAVSSSGVKAAVQGISADGMEVVDAVGADISFYHNGREVQPKGDVKLSLKAKREVKGVGHDAFTLSDSGAASIVADASSASSTFKTDHFTIYGIAGEDYIDEGNVHYVRHTYEFYAGDPAKEVSSWPLAHRASYINGDKLSVPAAPAGDSKYAFEGWFVLDDSGAYTDQEIKGGETVSVSPATLEEAAESGQERPADKTIRVAAKFSGGVILTYYTDDARREVLDTVILGRGGSHETYSDEQARAMGLVVDEHEKLTGWKDLATGAITSAGASTGSIDTDTELIPVYARAHHVRFETLLTDIFSDVDIDDQMVMNGEKAVEPSEFTEGDVYEGYQFTGWYTAYSETNGVLVYDENDRFDFGKTLTESDNDEILLYAGWVQHEVDFTVVPYLENQNDNGYTAYSGSERMQGKAGEAVPAEKILASFDNDRFRFDDSRPGRFHLSGCGKYDSTGANANTTATLQVLDKTGNVTAEYITSDGATGSWKGGREGLIAADGSTVVRVNYNRDRYSLRFIFTGNVADSGGLTLSEYGKSIAPEGYEDVTLPTDIIIKNAQYLYGVTHETYNYGAMFDAFLSTYPWYFDKTSAWLDSGGQTVFDGSNKSFAVRPHKTNDIDDGGEMTFTVMTYPSQKTYVYKKLYYDKAYSAEDLVNGSVPAGAVVKTETEKILYASDGKLYIDTYARGVGHAHQYTIGPGNGEYSLAAATNFAYAKNGSSQKLYKGEDGCLLENGTYSFYSKDGYSTGASSDTEAEEIVLHYIPNAFTITFRQTAEGKVNGWNISADTAKADVVSDDYTIYYGQDIRGIIKELAPDWKTLRDERGAVYWATDAWKGDVDEEGNLPETMPGRNLVFYKDWQTDTFTVTFDYGYVPKEGEQTRDVTDLAWGSKMPDPDPESKGLINREGHRLIRWEAFSRNADGTMGRLLDENFRLNTAVKQDFYLRAVWAEVSSYRIEYRSGDHGKLNINGRVVNCSLDSSVYMITAAAPLKYIPEADEGWVFTGWKAGGVTELPDPSVVMYSEELDAAGAGTEAEKTDGRIVLVAQYTDLHNAGFVTYHSNYPDGTQNREVQIGFDKVNGAYKVLGNDDFRLQFRTANGMYTFVCWTTEEGRTVFEGHGDRDYYYRGESVGAGSDDNHLYAVWKLADKSEVLGSYEPGSTVLGAYEDSSTVSKGINTGDRGYIIYAAVFGAALAGIVILLTRRRDA